MKKLNNNFSRVLCAVLLCVGLVLAGCTDDPLGNGENTEQEGGTGGGSQVTSSPVSVTLGTVTATTVQFEMTFAASAMSQYQEVGLIFSSVDDLDISAESVTIFQINRESYTKVFSGLTYNTKYYYTTYLKKDGFYSYGENKEFTTSDVLLNLSAGSITATSALISGTVEGLSETDKSLIEVGMFYSSEEGKVELGQGTKMTVSEIPEDNAVSFALSELVFGTTYYYCSYVKQGGSYVYGEVKSFMTTTDFIAPSGFTDLSKTETANCYIISQGGSYCLLVASGNKLSKSLYLATVSASVLWESFGTSVVPSVGELIKSVSYKDGYITFQTADIFKEGNAVIAAKNASGTILWSWHIWLTDQPQGQVYYNNAGTMMDRNLGAKSETGVGAIGLLYQWGRKDPFLGSSSLWSNTIAESTITWPSAVSSTSNGTIAYATAHPTTFITQNTNNNDWYYTGSSSTDDTRWTTSSSAKSIYDPCPAGWRVPDGGSSDVWVKASGSSYSYVTFDSAYRGINFSGKFGSASTIWYPASGYRRNYDGGLSGVGSNGSYWSASPSSRYAYSLSFYDNGDVSPSSRIYRAYGRSVRCIKE